MTGSETVDPEVLRSLAERLTSQLSPVFEQTLEHFEETEISGPAFSTDGLELQATYPGTRHLAMRDLESKAAAVRSIVERLKQTADAWDAAETHSTVKAR